MWRGTDYFKVQRDHQMGDVSREGWQRQAETDGERPGRQRQGDKGRKTREVRPEKGDNAGIKKEDD
jgi:hypothetical protein